LAEARDIESVLTIRASAEAMRAYAKQRDLGVQALNRCTEMVALAETRIGQEVERGRAEGTILKADEYRPPAESGSAGHRPRPASIAELGLKKHHNRNFKEMAEVPAEVIHKTVEAARVKTPSTSRKSRPRDVAPARVRSHLSPHRPVAPPGRASRAGGLD
jgi:hypothetical protein